MTGIISLEDMVSRRKEERTRRKEEEGRSKEEGGVWRCPQGAADFLTSWRAEKYLLPLGKFRPLLPLMPRSCRTSRRGCRTRRPGVRRWSVPLIDLHGLESLRALPCP